MSSVRRRYTPPETVSELLERYQAGERSFPRTVLLDQAIETPLPGIDFRDSHLRIVFSDTDLRGASFVNARLSFCHFDANLSLASFEGAELAWSNFDASKLTDANLRNTELRHASFKSADLTRCDFSSARLDETSLLDVSLASLCESSDVTHEGPSYVDHRAIIRSLRTPTLRDFLLRVGMPTVFAEYMIDCARSLDKHGVVSMLQSTFISYGAPDESFARQLNAALEANGVRTFFFHKHAPPGKKIHRLIRDGVNNCDRVILVCSRESLTRPGVRNEIEETLQREARNGGESCLIPIRLDDFVFHWRTEPDPRTAQSVRDRVVADFTGAAMSSAVFDTALQKLLAVLKTRSPSASVSL